MTPDEFLGRVRALLPALRERAVQLYRSTRPRPVVRRLANERGLDPNDLTGTGVKQAA